MQSKPRRMKLKHKLYALVLGLISLPLLVLAYSNLVMEKELNQTLVEHNSQLNYHNTTSARDAISAMKNIFSTTLSVGSPTATQEISQIFKQLEDYQDINLNFRTIGKQWMRALLDYPYITHISMISSSGLCVYMQSDTEVFFLTREDLQAPYYTQATALRGGYHVSLYGDSLRLSRAIIVPSQYKKLGVMTMDADFSFAMDWYLQHQLFASQRYGLYIDGVLAAGDIDLDAEQALALMTRGEAGDALYIDKAAGMVYLYTRISDNEDLLSFTSISYGEIFGRVFWQNSLIIVLVLLFALLLFLAVTFGVRSLLGTLRVFEKAFSQIEQGQFGLPITRPVEPELQGFLAAYNRMTVRLESLIDEVYRKNLSQTRLELQMLRNQINPHFFYNTLEALRMNSLIGREQVNVQIIGYLSAILRYGISPATEPVLLQDEIQHLEYYVSLHNLRADTQIALRVFVQDPLKDMVAMRMMFQPLVENAIQHGRPPDGRPLEICLMAYQEGEDVVFTLTDDGTGIPPETLAALQDRLAGGPKTPGSGIGLINVHRRIGLYFGAGYGLSVQSVWGRGTEIIIRVPFQQRKEKSPCVSSMS